MKAMVLNKFGGIENFEMVSIAKPQIQPNEVLIKTKKISLNPVDYKVRQNGGLVDESQLPVVLGWDVSGVVCEVGSEVASFTVDDAVFGMVNFPGVGAAYAEYVAAPLDQIAKKPDNVSFEEAAALTLAPLTAYQALIHVAKVKSGDRVLVQAAAGGVGHLAVQILKSEGAYVIGVASGKNEKFLKSIGVDEFIDYTKDDFATKVSDVDIVFDGVGGDVGKRSIAALKQGGTIICIVGGVQPDWVADRPDVQHPNFLVKSSGEDEKALAALAADGKLKVTIAGVFPLEKVGVAHLQLETQRTQGKIVLSI